MSAAPTSLRALACSLLLLPFATGPEAHVARWAPVTGERIEWCWRVESEHSLDEVELFLHASRPDKSVSAFTDAQLEVRDLLEVTARDIIVERDEYDPVRLERELVRARRGTSSDWLVFASFDEDDRFEAVSPFEGAELVFDWDADAGELRAAFAQDAEELVDEELLAGLDEGLDVRGLLGGLARAPGDTWQLDEAALLTLLRPGGELALIAPEADFEGQHDSAAFGWLLGAALVAGDGDAWGRAEYERVGWEGDRRVARIALRATVEGRGSVREALDRLVDTLGSGRNWLEFGKRIEVEHTLRFTGRLAWDLEAQRAHSLELEGSSESRIEFGLQLEFWSMDVTYVASLHGEFFLSVETEIVE